MKRLGLILLCGVVAACSGVDPIEPPSELTSYQHELNVTSRWSKEIGAGTAEKYFKFSPVLDGESIFVADYYGDVRAYHALTGERLWQHDLESAHTVSAGPSVAGQLLIFGGDSELFALDKTTGEEVWRTDIGSEVLSTPAVHDDVVVVHAVDGAVIALNNQTGKELWRHLERVPSLTLRGAGDPLIIDGVAVLVGTASGEVIVLRLQDGNLVWRTTVATPSGRTELDRIVDVDASLAVADGVIFAAAFQGRVVALHAANGQLLWSRDISSQNGIVLDESNIYLSDEKGDVWALARRNGATMWKQTALHRRSLSMPAQQGRYLVVGDFDGYLHWIHKDDGRLVARARVQNFHEYFPYKRDLHPEEEYRELRDVLTPPIVEGTRVYGFDRRGTLDLLDVSVVDNTDS